MGEPEELLERAYARAHRAAATPLIRDEAVTRRLELIARNTANRACARFLLACALAKTHRPEVDIRKPYTEIGDADAYSGRSYDEKFIAGFVREHRLPCNSTTAFLTPAFRNRNIVLTPEVDLVGRPASVYKATLEVLEAVHTGVVGAADVLAELIRWLIVVRDEREQRMRTLLSALKSTAEEDALSAEEIVSLVEKHMALKHTSRLPVLIVAAAYQAAQDRLGERVLPLRGHNVADKQVGSLGDLEITLLDDDRVVTSYDMK